MITTVILNIVSSVVSFFSSLLPTFSAPSWLTSDALGSSLASSIGSLVAPMNSILPVDAMLTVLQAMLLVLPVVILYDIFQWGWSHVPTIAGFGLGGGGG